MKKRLRQLIIVDRREKQVIGIRKEGDRADVYLLARKLLWLRLL